MLLDKSKYLRTFTDEFCEVQGIRIRQILQVAYLRGDKLEFVVANIEVVERRKSTNLHRECGKSQIGKIESGNFKGYIFQQTLLRHGYSKVSG
jgi:hypothetical protein